MKRSPQRHRVEWKGRLGGDRAAYRRVLRQTVMILTMTRRKLLLELALATGVAGAILARGWVALRKGCGPEALLCGNLIVHEFPSPSGKKKFVFFDRGCGATTGSTASGSILEEGDGLSNRLGNIFTAEMPRYEFMTDGGIEVNARWVNETEVVIELGRDLVLNQAQMEVNGVRIRLQELP